MAEKGSRKPQQIHEARERKIIVRKTEAMQKDKEDKADNTGKEDTEIR